MASMVDRTPHEGGAAPAVGRIWVENYCFYGVVVVDLSQYYYTFLV